MSPREFDVLRSLEDTHWWYLVLRTGTAEEVARLCAGTPDASLLDAGCGTGGMLAGLRQVGPAWRLQGVDGASAAVSHCRKRGLSEVRQGDVARLVEATGTLDGIVSLDVLYHRGVDVPRALSEFHRVLKPGGFLLLNLPAYDCLAGSHDRAVDGVRRYTPARVLHALESAGFTVERQHCWNAWLFLPILAWRRGSRWRIRGTPEGEVRSDLRPMPSWIQHLLSRIGRWDWRLCRVLRSPVGTSVFTVARKPPG